LKNKIHLLSFLLAAVILSSCVSKETKLPNIVIIYADDMGYGDLNCQNPNAKIPTPYLDQLASEGMRFTDAHSSSGICSPSRFALLTGMYHWRRQHGIVGAFGKPFFKDSDITLPQILHGNHYRTACIGKWHLGWTWDFKSEPSAEVMQWGSKRKFYRPDDIEWNNSIKGGPLDRGFDYYFGDGTINFPPYAWVENDRLLNTPTEVMDINDVGYNVKEGSWEFRPGPKVKDWNPYDVLPTLASKSAAWIKEQDNEKPFFLYFALPSPHAPIIPNDEFDGTSQAGAYGDFMVQSDWVVGQVLKALKESGLEENTIVIFSADNGPEAYAWKRAEDFGHFSMGNFRGLKRDVWEGGHHVPLIIKWPGKIKEGAVSDQLISQIDLMATLTSLTGMKMPQGAAPDSYDMSKILLGNQAGAQVRQQIVHNTNKEIWGMRKDEWLFINNNTGGLRAMPESFMQLTNYEDFEGEALLFNMKDDPEQRVNLYDTYPKIVSELDVLLTKTRSSESTVNMQK
jgi:arylsulfatase A-like enzyme